MTAYSNGVLALLGSDLSALWVCDESVGSLVDASGNNRDMAAFGASLTYRAAGPTINGEAHLAVQFPGNGSNRFATATSFPGASAVTGRTYGVWVYFPGTGSAFEWAIGRATSGDQEGALYATNTGTPFAEFYQENGTSVIAEVEDTGLDMDGGSWHLVMGWWDPSTQDVFVQVDDRTPVSAAGSTDINTNCAAGVTLGASYTGGSFMRSGARAALGFVVERVLTSDERADLYTGDLPALPSGGPPSFMSAAGAKAYSSGSPQSTLTINKPLGTVEGDLLLAFVDFWNDSIALGARTISSSGWTTEEYAIPFNQSLDAFLWKIAGASEPASYDFTISGDPVQGRNGGILRVMDHDPTTPLAMFDSAIGTSSNPNPPATGTLTLGDYLVAIAVFENHTTHNPPANYTERIDIDYTEIATRALEGITSEDPGALDTSTGFWSAFTVAVAGVTEEPPPPPRVSFLRVRYG